MGARRDGNQLLVQVEDDGVGIDLELQPMTGRAFAVRDARHHHSSSTLEFNSVGLGLGLSIARGIVEAHGGTIEIESRVGFGSTFEIRLPLVPAAAAQGIAA